MNTHVPDAYKVECPWLYKDFPSLLKRHQSFDAAERIVKLFYDIYSTYGLWNIMCEHYGRVVVQCWPLEVFRDALPVLPYEVPESFILDFETLIRDLIEDYTPNIGHLSGIRITNTLLEEMVSEFKLHEHLIIQSGGYSLRQELKYRLGLSVIREH